MSRPEAESSNLSSVRFSKVLPRRLRRGYRQCDHSPQDAEVLLCRSLRDDPTCTVGVPPALRVPSHVRSPLLRIKHRSDLTPPRSEAVEHDGQGLTLWGDVGAAMEKIEQALSMRPRLGFEDSRG